MNISGKKIISLFSMLLILFCLVPNSAFAGEDSEAVSPFASDEEAFDLMKSRMTESIDSMIENLENSKEDLDEDLLEDAEELITELELIKAELEDVETDSEMLDIRTELDSLIGEAPEELKAVLGPAGQGMSFGPGRPDGAGAPDQGFGNGSERDPAMMQNRSQVKDWNGTGDGVPEDRKMNKQSFGGAEENGDLGDADRGNADETGSENVGFFGKLINSIKSLFS